MSSNLARPPLPPGLKAGVGVFGTRSHRTPFTAKFAMVTLEISGTPQEGETLSCITEIVGGEEDPEASTVQYAPPPPDRLGVWGGASAHCGSISEVLLLLSESRFESIMRVVVAS